MAAEGSCIADGRPPQLARNPPHAHAAIGCKGKVVSVTAGGRSTDEFRYATGKDQKAGLDIFNLRINASEWASARPAGVGQCVSLDVSSSGPSWASLKSLPIKPS